ncbi:nucleotide kinase domain-containing protein [Owenweeksia hongkongensis]|uniref:nucleotide kinase domain-containing protein n=1 Tax=Owenweeksia hongkongensis TaxID=253245 RepID=UPI003A90899C
MSDFYVKRTTPKPSEIYDTYWKFAAERQAIFYKRLLHPSSPPWTDDIILRAFKFTNAYRAADRVSQFLISQVIGDKEWSSKDMLYRILLFKLFNKIETWQFLERRLGQLSWRNYRFKELAAALEEAKRVNGTMYSAAYIMASGKQAFGYNRKHENHLRLLEKMLLDGLDQSIASASSMEKVYNLLIAYPTIGSFLAYQLATDINYSNLTNFTEMEFVKAGPGARDGISKCFTDIGGYSEEDVIKWMTDRQEREFERLELHFDGLWGRHLQLIDCQNIFCEVDKYSRVAHPHASGNSKRTRIKQQFGPTSLRPLKYKFPSEWNLMTINIPNQKSYE